MASLPHSPIIHAEHVNKKIITGETVLTILSNINLTIFSGESVAIIGVSGSGKSTLLGLLAGLDLPTTGKIFLAEQNLIALSEEQRANIRRQYVGFIFQAFHLLPTLTALENVSLPLEIKQIPNADQLAAELLNEVGLAHRHQHLPRQLSGGEQQRVAIARAFACQPKILFADELTGNLDPHTAEQIIELLFALNKKQNTTLVLVTHDQTLAQRCQRCLLLRDGQLHEDEKHMAFSE